MAIVLSSSVQALLQSPSLTPHFVTLYRPWPRALDGQGVSKELTCALSSAQDALLLQSFNFICGIAELKQDF